MNWTHFILAVFLAGIVSSLTDWFFGGILFHGKYSAHPEIWRQGPGKSETPAVAWSIVLGFLTSGAFMAACVVFFGARIWRNAEARRPLLADRACSSTDYQRAFYQTASAGRRFSLARLAREAVCRGSRRKFSAPLTPASILHIPQ